MVKEIETLMSLSTVALALIGFSLIVSAPEKKPGQSSRARLRFVVLLCLLVPVATITPAILLNFLTAEKWLYQISAGIYMLHIWSLVLITIRQPKQVVASINKMLGGRYSTVLLLTLFLSMQTMLVICLYSSGQVDRALLYILAVTLNIFFAGHSFFMLTTYPVKRGKV